MLYTLFRLPLHIFLLYVVYTYTRDLETNFMNNCKDLKQSDRNVHEFLKFYTLLQACMVLLVIAITLTMLFSHFPKYTSMGTLLNAVNTKSQLRMKIKNIKSQS